MRKNPSVIKGIDSLGKLAYVSDSLADGGVSFRLETALISKAFIGTSLVVFVV